MLLQELNLLIVDIVDVAADIETALLEHSPSDMTSN